jgi:hypothetical protein
MKPSRLFVALALCFATLSTASCGPIATKAGTDVGACAVGQIPAAVQSVLPQVTKAIQGSAADWSSEIAALEAQGVDFAICSIEAVVADLAGAHAAASPLALDRAHVYLAMHGVKVAIVGRTPRESLATVAFVGTSEALFSYSIDDHGLIWR